ncbi:MAG: endolytic transglycosylase MltG [Devosia sp.]
MSVPAEDSRRRHKRRRNGLVDFGNAVLTFLVLVIIAAAAFAYFGLQQFTAPGPKSEETAFVIDEGSGLNSVATRLADQGIISNSYIFRAAVMATARDAKILPGQYIIPAKASMADILKIVTSGEPVEFFVTVPEGETAFLAAERIRLASNNLSGELTGDPKEGTILPGRYDWTQPTTTRQSVLADMQKRMSAKLSEAWAGRDKSIDDVIKTPEQLLTLASLVEKETRVASEHATVASVFVNRLRRGMKLQTDPSVLYGITLGKSVLNRGPTSKELRAETPYNTYVITGLPPGPIANPAGATLEATAHPAATKFLYFVAKSADPADGHLFAATYAEHRRNVAAYRQAVKAAEASEAAEAEAAKEEFAASEAVGAGDTTQ